jgi:hypothetical protein
MLVSMLGCMGTKPSPEIVAANDMKREAITNYAANVDQVLDVLLEGYRKEAYARIDTLVQIDMKQAEANAKASGGQVDLAQALEFFNKIDRQREEKRAEVDESIKQIRKVMATASVDLALNLKLDEVVQRYAQAGVDLTSAQAAIDQIMAIIKRARE